eukprot:1157427-Pelagomonas_calceolata.AAC.2
MPALVLQVEGEGSVAAQSARHAGAGECVQDMGACEGERVQDTRVRVRVRVCRIQVHVRVSMCKKHQWKTQVHVRARVRALLEHACT